MVKIPAFWLIAPYAVWMALMMLLPATAWAYAVRTVVVAGMLVVSLVRIWRLDSGGRIGDAPLPPCAAVRPLAHAIIRLFAYSSIGILVFLIWVLPEQFGWEWYRQWCIVGDGGAGAFADADVAMVAMRLIGSAFVISVAEELFFRKWLMGFAGFGWTVALFAIEHDRWLVGAVAGAVYGIMFLRHGLLASVVAHAATNMLLGVWVVWTGQWRFW